MLFSGSAAALALLSLLPAVSAQTLDQRCQYTPEWKKCIGVDDDRLECAAMKVAKSWKGYVQGESPETILRLIRYRAVKQDPNDSTKLITNDDANSIILNPGGPGASGINAVLEGGSYYYSLSGSQYHIVGFDPRGTGLNDPYTCTPPSGGPGLDLSLDSSYDSAFKYYTSKAAACKEQNPDLGTRIDSLQVAYDVDAITRAVNKDLLIRYMGFSYGTLLGNVIARQFGGRVERMTLDGNIDPNSYYYGPGLDAFTDADGAIEKFMYDCSFATAAQCAWRDNSQSYADLVTKFNDWVGIQALSKNRGRPDNSLLDLRKSSIVRSLVIGELKGPSGFAALASVLQDWYVNPGNVRYLCPGETTATYQAGKVCPAQKRQTTDPDFNPSTAANAKVSNNLIAITCVDNQLRPDGLSAANYKQWTSDATKITKYAEDSAVSYIESCATWSQFPAWRWADPWNAVDTKETILFINTYYDAVTPAISARNAASFYKKSQIVFTDGQGHCSSAQQSNDLIAALQKYWAPTGQVLPQRFDIPKSSNNGDTVFAVQNANPFTKTQNPAPVQADAGATDTAGAQPDATAAKLKLMFRDIDERMTPELPRPVRGLYARYDIRGRYQKRDNDTATAPEDVDFTICTFDNSTDTNTTTSATTASPTGYSNSTTTTSVDPGATTTGTGKGNSTTKSTTKITSSTTSAIKDGPYSPSGPYTTVDILKPTSITDGWNPWAAATTTTTKPKDPSTSWGPWSSQTNGWDVWTSQKDSVPVTKTICADKKNCKTSVVAVPTTTVYVDYVTDICATGLTTKAITVTATCNKGCDSKPTGVPQGYTTTAIYCSACAKPSTVTVTVKVSTTSPATQWVNVPDATSAKTNKPTSAASSAWSSWTGAATGSSKPASASGSGANGWGQWATATGSGPIAKYTGAASVNAVAGGSLFAVLFAGLFML